MVTSMFNFLISYKSVSVLEKVKEVCTRVCTYQTASLRLVPICGRHNSCPLKYQAQDFSASKGSIRERLAMKPQENDLFAARMANAETLHKNASKSSYTGGEEEPLNPCEASTGRQSIGIPMTVNLPSDEQIFLCSNRVSDLSTVQDLPGNLLALDCDVVDKLIHESDCKNHCTESMLDSFPQLNFSGIEISSFATFMDSEASELFHELNQAHITLENCVSNLMVDTKCLPSENNFSSSSSFVSLSANANKSLVSREAGKLYELVHDSSTTQNRSPVTTVTSVRKLGQTSALPSKAEAGRLNRRARIAKRRTCQNELKARNGKVAFTEQVQPSLGQLIAGRHNHTAAGMKERADWTENCDEQSKESKLLRNRISVMRCREKKRERSAALETEARALIRENKAMKEVVAAVMNSGIFLPQNMLLLNADRCFSNSRAAVTAVQCDHKFPMP